MKRLAFSIVSVLGLAAAAHADINGFGDFSGFRVNRAPDDTSAAPNYDLAGGGIHIVPAGAGALRSIFALQQQDVSQFTATYDYRVLNAAGYFGQGATFVIQNDPRGASAVGTAYGYSGYFGIGNSVGITMEFSASTGATASGLYTNGMPTDSSPSTLPLSFQSGHLIHASLTYNGTFLHEHLSDPVTAATLDRDYMIDIPATVGGGLAYVGFGASEYTSAYADQYIYNFHFSSVPSPAGASLLGLGGLAAVRRRRR